jgi:iron(III) transport system ATP-binding protein
MSDRTLSEKQEYETVKPTMAASPVIPDAEADVLHNPKRVQVRITNLSKSYKRRRQTVDVLRDISLDIEQGELLVLLGPSGCGKTTLLRCLAGLERPNIGSILLGNRAVFDAESGKFDQPNRRNVAMVFQNYALWPHMKVASNVAYPLKARGMKDKLNRGRVDEVLRVVQCDHLADRYPPELSGGQQQRVSLARALAPEPELLLLDEPLSNLDALLRIELRAQLRQLHNAVQFTGVYVTHDQEEALALGDRIAIMKEGRIEQIGPPSEVYMFPATEYAADFLGARNVLTLVAGDDGSAVLNGIEIDGLTCGDLRGDFKLRLRDSVLSMRRPGGPCSSADWWIPGAVVREVLPAGDSLDYIIELADSTLFIRVPDDQNAPAPGEIVEIGFQSDRALCYGPDGKLVKDWAKSRNLSPN